MLHSAGNYINFNDSSTDDFWTPLSFTELLVGLIIPSIFWSIPYDSHF